VGETGTDSTYVMNKEVTTSSYSFSPSDLPSGAIYTWAVRAKNAAGVGPWSSDWHFSNVSLGSFATLAPSSGGVLHYSYLSGWYFDWAPLYGAKWYRIIVSTSSTFSSYVSKDVSTDYCSLSLSELVPGQTYYWYVCAYGGSSSLGSGDFSIGMTLTSSFMPVSY
jgi:hypothetical protein